QGQPRQACRLHEQTLGLRKRVLGPDHPDTLRSMSNLGELLTREGKLARARRLVEDAAGLQRRTLGAGHPDTLASTTNLANVLFAQDQPREALRLHRQVLAAKRNNDPITG